MLKKLSIIYDLKPLAHDRLNALFNKLEHFIEEAQPLVLVGRTDFVIDKSQ